MKQKLIVLLGALCIAFAGLQAYAVDEYGTMSAKEKKQAQKRASKDAKKDAKENQKAGWVLNGSGSMEFAIEKHLLNTENYGGECEEKTGNAENCKSISLGKTKAFMDAVNSYAREQRMALKIQLTGEQSDIDEDQTDNILNEYQARVADEIKGVLKQSYILTKKLSNGHYDIQVFYLINNKNSAHARKQALQDAIDKSELRQEWKDKISKSLDW